MILKVKTGVQKGGLAPSEFGQTVGKGQESRSVPVPLFCDASNHTTWSAEKGDGHRAFALFDGCYVSCGTEPVPFFSWRFHFGIMDAYC
jgi:hypothetical protein